MMMMLMMMYCTNFFCFGVSEKCAQANYIISRVSVHGHVYEVNLFDEMMMMMGMMMVVV